MTTILDKIKDANWVAIRKWCNKHKIQFEGFPSIKEGKIDVIDKFLHRLEQEADEDLNESEEDEYEDEPIPMREGGRSKPINFFGGNDNDEEEDDDYDGEEYSDEEDDGEFTQAVPTKSEQRMFSNRNNTSLQPKERFQSPEYIIILDDISHELKMPSVSSLLKKNRHYKLKVIISSQYIKDLKPEALKQMDYFLMFKGLTEDKIQKIHDDGDLAVDLDTLQKVYADATKEQFGFLYVDTRNDLYRKNFDKMYIIN